MIAAFAPVESRMYFAALHHPFPPRFDHVVIVVEENKNYTDVIHPRTNPMFMPSPTAFLNQALFINKLASRGALLTNMHGETHPSQPNYLAMFSGSTQGITDDAP